MMSAGSLRTAINYECRWGAVLSDDRTSRCWRLLKTGKSQPRIVAVLESRSPLLRLMSVKIEQHNLRRLRNCPELFLRDGCPIEQQFIDTAIVPPEYNTRSDQVDGKFITPANQLTRISIYNTTTESRSYSPDSGRSSSRRSTGWECNSPRISTEPLFSKGCIFNTQNIAT